MLQNTAQQTAEPTPPGSSPRTSAMVMCPMAAMCKGMMKKPPSGLAVMLAGAVLIAVGVLIGLEPQILVWLMGAAFVMLGIMLLMMANFVRRLGVQLRKM